MDHAFEQSDSNLIRVLTYADVILPRDSVLSTGISATLGVNYQGSANVTDLRSRFLTLGLNVRA